jgi:hypothetical protein
MLAHLLPPLDIKNNMDANLCAGVGHDMPLLRSLARFTTFGFFVLVMFCWSVFEYG